MKHLTIFLIDDDPDDREIFAIALDELAVSHSCYSAKSGVEALDKFTSEPSFIPDFIFLDLNMPLLLGQQCLMQIKKMKHLENTPVIIYSTSSNELDIENTRRIGANHFLVKPSSLTTLVKQLNLIVSEKDLPYLLAES